MSEVESQNGQDGIHPENIVRIMVATDIHLGFAEKDPVRRDDSFEAFEESLQYARRERVDFILLGGDLFHENKPSRKTLHRCLELLRKYCLGDKPIAIEILSDQARNFSTPFSRVNYQDPNYNVALPVFTIHGNHDDPAGDGALTALDLLSVSNLVNYFGKQNNIDDISLYPILLRKGQTRVALYGLGNIRDERLYRTFQQKNVRWVKPTADPEHWFNLFVFHQNRAAHSPKNYIQEVMLDRCLDLVIWGHEHECLIKPQQSAVANFFVSQPGSTVVTSLCEGEAKPKCVAILEIHMKDFRLTPIELRTARPFVMEDVSLRDEEIDPDNADEMGRVSYT